MYSALMTGGIKAIPYALLIVSTYTLVPAIVSTLVAIYSKDSSDE